MVWAINNSSGITTSVRNIYPIEEGHSQFHTPMKYEISEFIRLHKPQFNYREAWLSLNNILKKDKRHVEQNFTNNYLTWLR